MPWSLHKQPPLTAREIEAIKKALASGVTMDNVRKRFHRSPKVLKKLCEVGPKRKSEKKGSISWADRWPQGLGIIGTEFAEEANAEGEEDVSQEETTLWKEYPMSKDADVNRVILESMERAGTPPEIVYAYRKTGRVVTQENSKLLSQDELEEWNAAIAEYFKNGGIADGPIHA